MDVQGIEYTSQTIAKDIQQDRLIEKIYGMLNKLSFKT